MRLLDYKNLLKKESVFLEKRKNVDNFFFQGLLCSTRGECLVNKIIGHY